MKNDQPKDEQSGPEEEIQPEIPLDEVSQLKDLLQRTQANFENYRKQVEKRNEELRKFAAKNVIMQLLPVIDNFELALKSVEGNEPVREGIELIYGQLIKVLEAQGVEESKCLGKQFDPYLHEPLFKGVSVGPVNIILEVYQKGYVMHGQVLRHAKVKISIKE